MLPKIRPEPATARVPMLRNLPAPTLTWRILSDLSAGTRREFQAKIIRLHKRLAFVENYGPSADERQSVNDQIEQARQENLSLRRQLDDMRRQRDAERAKLKGRSDAQQT